jgi:hypothetical protein
VTEYSALNTGSGFRKPIVIREQAVWNQPIARAARKALYLACSNFPCELWGEERKESSGFRCETF